MTDTPGTLVIVMQSTKHCILHFAYNENRDRRPQGGLASCPFCNRQIVDADKVEDFRSLEIIENAYALTMRETHLIALPRDWTCGQTPTGSAMLMSNLSVADLLRLSIQSPDKVIIINILGATIPAHPHAQIFDFGGIRLPLLNAQPIVPPVNVSGLRLFPQNYAVVAFQAKPSLQWVEQHFGELIDAMAAAAEGPAFIVAPSVLMQAGRLYLVPRRTGPVVALDAYKPAGLMASTEMAGLIVLAANDLVRETLATASGRREIAARALRDLRRSGYPVAGLAAFVARMRKATEDQEAA